MKLSIEIKRKSLIASGVVAGIIFLGVNFNALIQTLGNISKGRAASMITDDLKKIEESKKAVGERVKFDYVDKVYPVSKAKLSFFLYKIDSISKNNYVLIKFGFNDALLNKKDKSVKNYSDFGLSILGINQNEEELNNISPFNIQRNEHFSGKYYNNVFGILKKNNVRGHNHDNNDGVKFTISEALEWVKNTSGDSLYFYPAFNASFFAKDFTTIIISDDKRLRERIYNREKIKEESYYDKGSSCCSYQ